MILLFIIGFSALITGFIFFDVDNSYCLKHNGAHSRNYVLFGSIICVIGFFLLFVGFIKFGEMTAYKNILYGKQNPYEMKIQYYVDKNTISKDTVFVKID